MSEPIRSKIQARKALQRAPGKAPAEFEPLATCPETERSRWARRAELAASQPQRAIEIKCLECCCWSRPEAARCEIRGCPLFAFYRRIFSRGGANGG